MSVSDQPEKSGCAMRPQIENLIKWHRNRYTQWNVRSIGHSSDGEQLPSALSTMHAKWRLQRLGHTQPLAKIRKTKNLYENTNSNLRNASGCFSNQRQAGWRNLLSRTRRAFAAEIQRSKNTRGKWVLHSRTLLLSPRHILRPGERPIARFLLKSKRGFPRLCTVAGANWWDCQTINLIHT